MQLFLTIRKEYGMAKSENQKLKINYIAKILTRNTSKDNGITLQQLTEKLNEYGISAERKSLYSDIRLINEFGDIRIEKYKKDGNYFYYATSNLLSLGDIKLLTDAVAASKFISEDRSKALIRRLENMVSEKEERQLDRTVVIRNRAGETIRNAYDNVDLIHRAMQENRQISFTYMKWDVNKKMVVSGEAVRRGISPWRLLYDNDNYYLLAYVDSKQDIRTFRVDKMSNVKIAEESRHGESDYRKTNPENYAESRFLMYDGEPERVTVKCPSEKIGLFLDMFGTDITIRQDPLDEAKSEVSMRLVPSRLFLGWLLGLGHGIQLVSPQSAVDTMEEMCEEMLRNHVPREITTVVFDLGMVLLEFRYHEYMKELNFSKANIELFENEILFRTEWQLLDAGQITQEEAIERWVTRYPESEKAIRLFFKNPKRLVIPYKDTDNLIRRLHDMGYRVYALSNYSKEMFEYHEKYSIPFLQHLDGYMISAKEKMAKPDTAFYEAFFNRYHLKPEECVFLDDRKENVTAAERCRMHGILADPRKAGLDNLFSFLEVHRPKKTNSYEEE